MALHEAYRAGYSFAETAGYDAKTGTFFGLNPTDFGNMVRNAGLRLLGGHMAFAPHEVDKACENAAKAGIEFLVCSSFAADHKEGLTSYHKLASFFNLAGKKAKQYGLQFAYHNHHFEFEEINGVVPYDVLLQHTDPAYVFFEMDLGWVVFAGHAPVDYFNKYPGRFPLWHIRDIDPKTNNSVAIGHGNINFGAFFKAAELAGLRYPIVEIGSQVPNALNNIILSYQYLQAADFFQY